MKPGLMKRNVITFLVTVLIGLSYFSYQISLTPQYLSNYFKPNLFLRTSWKLTDKTFASPNRFSFAVMRFSNENQISITSGNCHAMFYGSYEALVKEINIKEDKSNINYFINSTETCDTKSLSIDSSRLMELLISSQTHKFAYSIHGHTLVLQSQSGERFYFVNEDDYDDYNI